MPPVVPRRPQSGVRTFTRVLLVVVVLVLATVLLAVLGTQTPWFKERVRRYVVREAAGALNGELSIGRISGSLFTGVTLTDVAIRQRGGIVIAAERVEATYDPRDFLARAIVLNHVEVTRPTIVLARAPGGQWNITQLIRRRPAQPDRPATTVDLGSVIITGGTVVIEPIEGAATTVRVPRRLTGLEASLRFATTPRYTELDVQRASFTTEEPALGVKQVTAAVRVEGTQVTRGEVSLETTGSRVRLVARAGDMTQWQRLEAQLVTEPLSGPEIARIVPAVLPYLSQPRIDLAARGDLAALRVTGTVEDAALGARIDGVVNLSSPRRAVQGTLDVARFDARRLNPSWMAATGNGRAQLDVSWSDRGDLAGDAALVAKDLVLAGYRIAEVDARLGIAGRRVQIDGRIGAYGARARSRGWVDLATPSAPAYDVSGSIGSLDLARLPRALRVPAFASTLAGTYRVAGSGAAMQARITFDPSVIEGARIGAGSVADVTLGQRLPAYGFSGTVSGLDVPRLGRVLGIPALTDPRWAARLSGDITVRGEGTRLPAVRLDAEGRLRDVEFAGGQAPAVDLRATLSGGALEVVAAGDVARLDPSRLTANPRHAGLVNGSFDVSVRIPDVRARVLDVLQLHGRVDVRDSRVGPVRVDRVDADGAFSPDRLDLRSLDVSGPGLEVTARGGVALADRGQSDAVYHANVRDLAPLGDLAGVSLRGSGIVEGTVSGQRASLRTDGTFRVNGFAYGERAEALTLAGKFDVTVPDLDLARVSAHASIDGTLLKVAGRELRTAGVALDYANRQLDADATLRDPKRTLSARASLRFLPEGREILVNRLGLAMEGLEWTSATQEPATITWRPDRVMVRNLALANGPQRVSVEGEFATGERASGVGTLAVTDVSVADLARIGDVTGPVSGRLNGTATLTGGSTSRAFDANVRVDQGAVGEVPFESLIAAVRSAGRTRLGVEARLVQRPGAAFEMSGTVPAPMALGGGPEGGELDLRLSSTPIDLALAQAVLPELDKVTGQLRADLRVTGTFDAPRAAGSVDVTGGAFAIKGTSASYTGLDTSLRLDGDRITIDRLRILDDDEHPLDVAGQISLQGRAVSAAELTVKASGFEVLDTKVGDIEVDADLAVHGTALAPEVRGDVTLRSGRLELEQLFSQISRPYSTEATAADRAPAPRTASPASAAEDADIVAASRKEAAAAREAREAAGQPPGGTTGRAEPPEDSLFRRAAMDVRLRLPDNFVLRGNDVRMPGGRFSLGDLNVTLGGDLRLRKPAGGDLVAVGTVETVRGTYDFQGRRFTVERDGRISFRGLDPTNPDLDVSGTREISGIVARVNVSGSARAPVLRLSSDPPLDETDVLSLIVFNSPANQLGEAQQGNLAERAASLASGFVVSPLTESLQRSLDIDVFEVQAVTETGGGPAITVGEQVGDRLFAQLRQQFGSQDVTEVLLEYRLADFLRLQGAFAEGQSRANRSLTRRVERVGIDLVFVFSY